MVLEKSDTWPRLHSERSTNNLFKYNIASVVLFEDFRKTYGFDKKIKIIKKILRHTKTLKESGRLLKILKLDQDLDKAILSQCYYSI